jgi:ATP-dependent DNA helicase RecG
VRFAPCRFREAVINAVVCVGCEQRGVPVHLVLFDDRMEIENPGLLLFGLIVDDIKRDVSKLCNRAIGRVFYKLGLIEQWGSGIKRIIESYRNAGFDELGTHFRVAIFTEQTAKPCLDEID